MYSRYFNNPCTSRVASSRYRNRFQLILFLLYTYIVLSRDRIVQKRKYNTQYKYSGYRYIIRVFTCTSFIINLCARVSRTCCVIGLTLYNIYY